MDAGVYAMSGATEAEPGREYNVFIRSGYADIGNTYVDKLGRKLFTGCVWPGEVHFIDYNKKGSTEYWAWGLL